jgi:cAMP phosphodiesterase
MKIRHNKFRNTGILFELLIRQVTSDTVSGRNSPAINLIRKYFSKNELAKEHKLYQALVSSKVVNESKAESLINATLELSTRLNRTNLRKEKYNLIKEIKEYYDIEEFFKAKINNYTPLAAAYNIIEAKNTKDFIDPNQVIENKNTLLEHIIRKESTKHQPKDKVLEEYASMDSSTKLLVYKILLEKFNEKYIDLSPKQKSVLKEYISNISNTTRLRDYVNDSYKTLRNELTKLTQTVTDKTIQIKLNEVITFLKPLDKKVNVKDDHIMALLQYHQLVNELKSTK